MDDVDKLLLQVGQRKKLRVGWFYTRGELQVGSVVYYGLEHLEICFSLATLSFYIRLDW
jgi:hypothetical protein